MDEQLRSRLEREVKAGPVVLFMKGTPSQPRCGFSATVAGILDELVGEYRTVDVLSDAAVRDGIKEFSDWPTIPQLYLNGEFVGGCDVVREMFDSGELEEALGQSPQAVPPPAVEVSEAAMEALLSALGEETPPEAEYVRVEVDEQYNHGLSIGPAQPRDIEVRVSPQLCLRFDRASARRAEGLSIDCVEGDDGPTFKLENPNQPPSVRSIDVASMARLLEQDPTIELFDVRTSEERAQASIGASKLLDRAARDYIESLPRQTSLYFHCHHGARSLEAATFFLQQGFLNVYNVAGGIDAWSQQVDPSVPRYQRAERGVRLV